MSDLKFALIDTDVEIGDDGSVVDLYCRYDFHKGKKVIEYITVDNHNQESERWVATKDPELLTDEERHEILSYCLPSHDKDEIVNYRDLFIHGKFIKRV